MEKSSVKLFKYDIILKNSSFPVPALGLRFMQNGNNFCIFMYIFLYMYIYMYLLAVFLHKILQVCFFFLFVRDVSRISFLLDKIVFLCQYS